MEDRVIELEALQKALEEGIRNRFVRDLQFLSKKLGNLHNSLSLTEQGESVKARESLTKILVSNDLLYVLCFFAVNHRFCNQSVNVVVFHSAVVRHGRAKRVQ